MGIRSFVPYCSNNASNSGAPAGGKAYMPATVGEWHPVVSGKLNGSPVIRHRAMSAKMRASIYVPLYPYRSEKSTAGGREKRDRTRAKTSA